MSLSRKNEDPDQESEINIIPLVDVSLVLLVIFMVTATFAKATSLHIQVPQSSAAAAKSAAVRIDIGVDKTGAVFFAGRQTTQAELAADLSKRLASQTEVHIQGDQRASYGAVASVMEVVRKAGFTRIVQ